MRKTTKLLIGWGEEGPVYVDVEEEIKKVQFADTKKRVEVIGGKNRGDLGYVWYKDGAPARTTDKSGYRHPRNAGRYLQVEMDSGLTLVIEKRFVKVLSDLEVLYIETDDDAPDRPPRLEEVPDTPKGPVEKKEPEKRVRKLGAPPRLEDL